MGLWGGAARPIAGNVTAEPPAGRDARARAERRAELRLLRDIEMIGGLGRIDYLHERMPSDERLRPSGEELEQLTAKRLERHLRGTGVVIHHDLLIPGTQTRIDHITVGPGGVTVIASRSYEGEAELRDGQLFLGGRRQARLIDRLDAQLGVVRMALVAAQIEGVDVAGALSVTNLDGNPLAEDLTIGGILVEDAGEVARFAARQPSGDPLEVEPAAGALRARLAA